MFKKSSIEQLQKALQSAKNFKTTIYVEVDGFIKMAQVTSDEYCKFVRSYLFASPGCSISKHTGHDNIAEAFAELANLLPVRKIFPETTIVISEQPNLVNLSKSAWCEALGHQGDHAGSNDKSKTSEDFCEQILRDNLWKKLTGGASGIQQWNAVVEAEGTRLLKWNGSNLDGAYLKAVYLTNLELNNSRFEKADLESSFLFWSNISHASFLGANLVKANLTRANATGANFTDASLRNAILADADLANAILKNTDLRKADLNGARLHGVDLTTANTDGANFVCAKYDEETVLPTDFLHWPKLLWQGEGPDPYQEMIKKKIETLAVEKFEEMVAHAKKHFDASRLDKVLKMLKKERFELFSETQDKSVIGVVKSQTDPELIYACSLSSDGAYSCCTQNLRPCGGLKGALCKHILVLVIGLARANNIDLTKATKWILTSIDKDPSTNKTVIAEVFLKYQAANAGEIDWRPTETIPEDYYAF